MRLIDKLELCFRRILRDKKNAYFMFVLIFLTIILLFVLNFKSNFLNYIDKTIVENIGFRTLLITPVDGRDLYEDMKDIDYIQYAYSSKYDSTPMQTNLNADGCDNWVTLKAGSSYTLPKNIIGETFEDTDSGVAICPLKFYPSTDASELIFDKSKMIDGRKLLGTTFEAYYSSYKIENNNVVVDENFVKSFKIIGLYDSVEMGNTADICYVSANDVKQVRDIKLEVNGADTIYGIYAIVDQRSNVDSVISEFENLGYKYIDTQMIMDEELINSIVIICNVVIVVIVAAVMVMGVLYIKKKLLSDMKSIRLLRSIGFTKKDIIGYLGSENFIISFLSFVIGLCLFYFIYLLVQILFIQPFLNSIFKIQLYISNTLWISLIIVFVPLIVFLASIVLLLNKRIIYLAEDGHDL